MIIRNNSFLSYENSTVAIADASGSSTIITIIILSFLSISGWIFMSYALFGRSEAYRTKPDDQFGTTHHTNDSDNANDSSFLADLD